MTTATLVPNQNILVGSSGTFAYLSDGNDATYVDITTTYDTQFGLTTFALPAGALVKSAQLVVRGYNRGNGIGGSELVSLTYQTSLRTAAGALLAGFTPVYTGTTPTTRTSAPTALGALDQATVDGLTLWCRHITAATGGSPDYLGAATEMSVAVVYATQPTVTVTAPTGAIVVASPTAVWTFAGSPDADSAGIQQRYQVKVFTAAQYGAAGFDPATSAPVYDSGEVVTNATSAPVGPLPNALTGKAYVRAAQNVNGVPHWSAWTAGPQFTTNTDPPVVAKIVAASSSAAALRRAVGPSQHAYIEPTTGTVTTPDPGPLPAQCVFVYTMRLPADLTTHDVLVSQDDPGQRSWSLFRWYAATTWVWSQSPDGSAEDIQAASGNPLSGTDDQTWALAVNQNSGGHRSFQAHRYDGAAWVSEPPWTAPLLGVFDSTAPIRIGANYGGIANVWQGRIYSVELRTGLDPSAGSVIWRFDADEYPGTGTTWTDPRGTTWTMSTRETIVADGAVKITVTRDTAHTDWTHVNVERSAVDRISWEPVRGALELVAPDDVVVAHDYEQPDGVDLYYRARGIVKSGAAVVSQGPWLATNVPILWTPSDCGEYLRDPADPFGAVLAEVLVDEATTSTEHRVGLLDVIGRASPVSVWDIPSLATGTLPIVTRTYAEGTALYDLVRTAPVLLWQGRRAWGHPHRWLVITNHTVSRYPSADPSWAEYREWALDYVEVDPPPVLS